MELDQQLVVNALKSEREYTDLPYSLHIFDSLSSTNQTAWDLLTQGAKPGCVVIATQQTAGRGQWGRQWVSPTGGLYLSVGISPKLIAADAYQLTLASAWGIAAQLRKCGVSVGIKWPNDLVLDGRKLGGILTETKVHKEQITQAVIGVGINWSNPVPETGINLEMWQKWQKFPNLRPISCLEMLTSTVLLGIESGLECLSDEGIGILLSRYLDLLTNMGDQVYVNNLLGTVVGVTPQGNLRLRMAAYDTQELITPEISVEPGTISLGYCKSSV
ncbi:biotin--[acetyl-CoA-carboxylase] ligase [Trichormus variabilis]|uniref:Biotin--[acetyl-CoA-carboxylase] ligase n=1 Tax=Trichormus variabilis SAG 1403-4b TaxID=447716 RepID=A0A433V093_ANAVA|nr:biotin--[acetyl-CoA-carboxylase] ligase [Trichormus variabilis]MBD2625174.1 biotin--[acetyl-CoA-carboxylase] ligase [Trichormus variabilis FACHB-164]RUS99545.1 biotin--[acetyl-CoA-carboxylase] ligase [Trichormus variabilis SAG 1403-4b]